jgi:hypothetical protein
MLFISTFINGLFTHIGQTILFSLPENWPLIGGDITLESTFYGMINGLIIGALYLAFNIINKALSIKQLTQFIPRAFHPIAMTATIALTFFPSIQQRAREIKEAQMIRGNPMKKIPDWLPILLPLIVSSLERAILLSESMTSRGFNSLLPQKVKNLPILGLILMPFFVFSGWILYLYDYPRIFSIAFYGLSGLILIFFFYFIKQNVVVTRYRREIWGKTDILFGVIFVLSNFGLIILILTDQLDLTYTPFPNLSIPDISFLGLLFAMTPFLPFFALDND